MLIFLMIVGLRILLKKVIMLVRVEMTKEKFINFIGDLVIQNLMMISMKRIILMRKSKMMIGNMMKTMIKYIKKVNLIQSYLS